MTPSQRPAVVTGASSGIGAATAVLLGRAGHPVVLGARRLDRCEEVARSIRAEGGTAFAVELDVADQGSREAFLSAAGEAVGDLEVFVSNAARNVPAASLDADEQAVLEHLQVNLLGVQALVREIGRGMVERGRGDLCFVTSEVVREPRPWVSPYVTSKAALEGWVTALRMELEGTGVRVTCVRPGQTLTEMGFDWDPEETGRILASWKRWGLARHPHFMPPEGVAAAVLACVGAPAGVGFAVVDVEPVPPRRTKEDR